MKRSLGNAELPFTRSLVPAASDDVEHPSPTAPHEPAPAPVNAPNAAQHAPMVFPGPFAFFRKPAVMQDPNTQPGLASSAAGEPDGLAQGATTATLPGSSRYQPHSEPVPAACRPTTGAASISIAHPSVSDDNPQGFSPLILAAFKGRLAEVELLLKDPVLDIDQIDQNSGGTALIAASCANKPEMVACLLAAGAKVNLVCGRQRRTALMEAAGHGHVEVLKALLTSKDIALDQTDAKGWRPLFLAAYMNAPDVVACLLAAGANVDLECGEPRRTALMVAALWGHVEVVRTLLTCKDIALDQADIDGRNALFLAASENKPEVVTCLLAAGANVNFKNGRCRHTALGVAAAHGHVEVVKTLLTCERIALNQTVADGISALVLAAFNNRAEVVACLLAAGAGMMVADANGRTALTAAIANRHAAVVEVLVQYGAALPGFQAIDTARSRSAVAFAVTLADLDAERTSPAHARDNPLGLVAPYSLDDPLAVIDELRAVLELEQDLQQWLMAKGIRAACALPVVECLASLAARWPVLADGRRAATTAQKRLICASALSRLSVLTAEGQALAHYRVAKISAAGLADLSAVATRQIEKLIAVSEQLLTTMGRAMLENLVPDCLGATSLARQVDAENLVANLVSAGWLPPLARVIVTCWKAALTVLESQPVSTSAESTMKQITQLLCDSIEHKAPPIFALAIQRELAAPALLAALRTWIGDAKSVEGVDLLFQIQCDQLRQYCEQIVSAG